MTIKKNRESMAKAHRGYFKCRGIIQPNNAHCHVGFSSLDSVQWQTRSTPEVLGANWSTTISSDFSKKKIEREAISILCAQSWNLKYFEFLWMGWLEIRKRDLNFLDCCGCSCSYTMLQEATKAMGSSCSNEQLRPNHYSVPYSKLLF
jgi:hypothetical protein